MQPTRPAHRRNPALAAAELALGVVIGRPDENGNDHSTYIGKLLTALIIVVTIALTLLLIDGALLIRVWNGRTDVVAISETGAVIKTAPLDEAFVTEPRMLSTVDECIRRSFSHDFVNYRRTFNDALPCYTESGGKAFATAIDTYLKDLRERRLVMATTTEPAAVARGPYRSDGRVTWDVQVPVTLYYNGQSGSFTPLQRLATLRVVRVPLEENTRAVAIDSMQLSPYQKR
ncbi:DotI/IcmL family type IV secretion protein [Cupriavidus sp. TMH.W2]|uniref:DotI/IcmL family type IV secretion protein n=1 Tax=Cupriavidus sp. TMH.W2 TaxID=3434465 RepID=UPI003D7844B5